MKRIFFVMVVVSLILFAGCSRKPKQLTEEEARSYIKEAVIDLNKISDFEATSKTEVKINGTVTDLKTSTLISHSSGEYDASSTEVKNGNQQNGYHRAIINGTIYEFNNKKGLFDQMPTEQSAVSSYDLYVADRSDLLDFVNQIYNQNTDSFGGFVQNLMLEKETRDKNGPVFTFSYRGDKATDISNITESGEITLAYYKGELILSLIKDTYHAVFKKDGMVADTVTSVTINNIGSARAVTPPTTN
ncbi:MAG: hypothetical protein ACPL3B_08700 [Fervidobacterium sp.]